ncbi:MAG: hypothetical protein QOI88_621, partial [Gammaproteobacteria bacterium]|nr:hypothetical protein [Gammaproteobacteria bacterium]
MYMKPSALSTAIAMMFGIPAAGIAADAPGAAASATGTTA